MDVQYIELVAKSVLTTVIRTADMIFLISLIVATPFVLKDIVDYLTTPRLVPSEKAKKELAKMKVERQKFIKKAIVLIRSMLILSILIIALAKVRTGEFSILSTLTFIWFGAILGWLYQKGIYSLILFIYKVYDPPYVDDEN